VPPVGPAPARPPHSFRPPWGMSPAQWNVFSALIDSETEAQERATRLDVQLGADSTGTLRRAADEMRAAKSWLAEPGGQRNGSMYRNGGPAAVFTGELVRGEIG
jgi:hypothetical protein